MCEFHSQPLVGPLTFQVPRVCLIRGTGTSMASAWSPEMSWAQDSWRTCPGQPLGAWSLRVGSSLSWQCFWVRGRTGEEIQDPTRTREGERRPLENSDLLSHGFPLQLE